MDQATDAVRQFLASMEPVREALGNLLRRLYERPAVKHVTLYNPLAYASSDFGLSAELHSGAVIDFWLDLTLNAEQWQLQYSVQRHGPDEEGSHPEVEFPELTINSASELPKAIFAAVERLHLAGEQTDLYR